MNKSKQVKLVIRRLSSPSPLSLPISIYTLSLSLIIFLSFLIVRLLQDWKVGLQLRFAIFTFCYIRQTFFYYFRQFGFFGFLAFFFFSLDLMINHHAIKTRSRKLGSIIKIYEVRRQRVKQKKLQHFKSLCKTFVLIKGPIKYEHA